MLVLHVAYFELPVNSSTIQDLHFPILSSTFSFHFQDVPGTGKSRKQNPGLSMTRGNPDMKQSQTRKHEAAN